MKSVLVDMAATLMLLSVVLIGGYVFVNDYREHKEAQRAALVEKSKVVEKKQIQYSPTFEHMNKRTE